MKVGFYLWEWEHVGADHFPHSRLLLGGITTRGRRGPPLPPPASPSSLPYGSKERPGPGAGELFIDLREG